MRLVLAAVACLVIPAWAQNACDECRNAALSQSTLCHHAALSPTDAADCVVKLQDAREKCQLGVCKSEAENKLYALCPECAKMEREARGRCEKNFCRPPPPKKP